MKFRNQLTTTKLNKNAYAVYSTTIMSAPILEETFWQQILHELFSIQIFAIFSMQIRAYNQRVTA